MNIIVNAIPLTGLLTGISRYVRCLYTALQRMQDVSISYFSGRSCSTSMPSQAEPASWTHKTELIWRMPDCFVTAIRSLFWLSFERRLRAACWGSHFDIYHETGFFPAAVKNMPVVYTMYDISLLKYRAEHPRERVWFFDLFFKRRIKYAAHIITISDFMRKEIVNTLGIAENHITAIPLAHDAFFYPRQEKEIDRALADHRFPREYILFVGTLEPRKNISLLIRALSMTKSEIPLILVGWSGWGDKTWWREITELGLEKRVHAADYLNEETLACLYSGARALVYPSLYEGFGLPVLEAMACGCPVLCSNTSSLPEVAGTAALFVEHDDPDYLARKIDRILQDSAERNILIEKGLQRAALFSWEKTAEQTVELFKRIKKERGSGA
jgi:glycosyltransferase involved in cell wall biosynthesis